MDDFEKAAFIGSVIKGGLSLAKGVGKKVVKHPVKSLGTGVGALFYGSEIASGASTAAGRAGTAFNVAPPIPSGVF